METTPEKRFIQVSENIWLDKKDIRMVDNDRAGLIIYTNCPNKNKLLVDGDSVYAKNVLEWLKNNS